MSYETMLDISRMQRSNQEHEAIFNAITRRDPESAARLVTYHSQSVRERLSPFFNEDEFRKVASTKEIEVN